MSLQKNHRWLAAVFTLGMVCAAASLAEPGSGYEYIKPATRALQDDDFENPGMLAVDRGNEFFNSPLPGADRACADCHETDGAALDIRHIAQYPKIDHDTETVVTLQDRLVTCSGSILAPGDAILVDLETFVRHLAKGKAVNVDTGGIDSLLARGEKLFTTRYGLIDMACQHCHVFYPGSMIRGQRISEGMGNGFPAYRLDTGEITTLQKRIQQCMTLMRAEPFASGSDELHLLELYMMSRSNGLAIETPAVRY